MAARHESGSAVSEDPKELVYLIERGRPRVAFYVAKLHPEVDVEFVDPDATGQEPLSLTPPDELEEVGFDWSWLVVDPMTAANEMPGTLPGEVSLERIKLRASNPFERDGQTDKGREELYRLTLASLDKRLLGAKLPGMGVDEWHGYYAQASLAPDLRALPLDRAA